MTFNTQPPPRFDSTSLEPETCLFVQEKTQAFHMRLKRTAEDVIVMGQDLLAVKACLKHGQFLPWLRAEFDMTDRQALNFMRVPSCFSAKSEIISDLALTIFYELAAPQPPRPSSNWLRPVSFQQRSLRSERQNARKERQRPSMFMGVCNLRILPIMRPFLSSLSIWDEMRLSLLVPSATWDQL